MSIEKIIERIKMIENNDFNITENTLDIDTVKTIRAGKKSSDSAERIARDILGGFGDDGTTYSSSDSSGNYIALPSQFEKQVQPILILVKKYELTDDLNSSGKPVFGYSKPVFKGGRNNTLVLQKSEIVQVEFIDDSLSKLKSINVKKYKSPNSNVNAFFNEVLKNKDTYGVKTVTNTQKFIVIKFI
jgi:hypothetical protein